MPITRSLSATASPLECSPAGLLRTGGERRAAAPTGASLSYFASSLTGEVTTRNTRSNRPVFEIE